MVVITNQRGRVESPMHAATTLRSDMTAHLAMGAFYRTIVPPNVAALIIGIDREVLTTPHFKSVLLSPAGSNFELVAGTTYETAQHAFNAWASDTDPRVQLHFDVALYKALFGLVQLVRTGDRPTVIKHMKSSMTPLLLEALGVRTDNEKWDSIVSDVVRTGEFDLDSYMTLIQSTIEQIVQRLEPTATGKVLFDQYPPDRLTSANRLP